MSVDEYTQIDHRPHLQAILEALDRHTEYLGVLARELTSGRRRLFQGPVVANGAGRALAQFGVAPGGVTNVWLIERMTQSTTSTGTPSFGLYVVDQAPQVEGPLDDLWLVDFTTVMPKAVADEVNPIPVRGGEMILGQWQGLSAGAICKAAVQIKQAWQGSD